MNADAIQADVQAQFQGLLTQIEDELLYLTEESNLQRLHTLMQAAHALKETAASVNETTIRYLAQALEAIFAALYAPQVSLDDQMAALLFEGYECLRLLLSPTRSRAKEDEVAVTQRAAWVITQLQEQFGDAFKLDYPDAKKLEFDIAATVFKFGVTQRLTLLQEAIAEASAPSVTAASRGTLRIRLTTYAEIFLELAELLDLKGFGAIASHTLTALKLHPSELVAIAKVALTDFTQGQQAVLQGDRFRGGHPSPDLKRYAGVRPGNAQEGPPKPSKRKHRVQRKGARLRPKWAIDIKPSGRAMPKTGLSADHITTLPVGLNHLHQLDQLMGELMLNQDIQGDEWTDAKALETSLLSCLRQHSQSIQEFWEWAEHRLDAHKVDAHKIGAPIMQKNGDAAISAPSTSSSSSPLSSSLPLSEPSGILSGVNPLDTRILQQGDWGVSTETQPTQPLIQMAEPLPLETQDAPQKLIQSALDNMEQLEGLIANLEQWRERSHQSLQDQNQLLTRTWNRLTQARLQSLDEVFQRLANLLDQLTESHGKQVNLMLPDRNIEVDWAVMDMLSAPLWRLVRNAVTPALEAGVEAYGAETNPQDEGALDAVNPQGVKLEAVAKVQPPNPLTVGTLWIRARARGQKLVIEMEGDGAKIDLSAVPLEGVRSRLAELNGTVSVQTGVGKGAQIMLECPASLTRRRQLFCQADGATYAISLDQIVNVIVPQSEQLQTTIGGIQMLRLRQDTQDSLVRVYSLTQLMQYSTTRHLLTVESPWQADAHAPVQSPAASAPLKSTVDGPKSKNKANRSSASRILMIRIGLQWAAIMVDAIIGEQDAITRSLGQAIAPPPCVSGCCLFGDNQLALVLDLPLLMQQTVGLSAEERLA